MKGRTTWYETLEEMQKDLDEYLKHYNTQRPHRGRNMDGRTPYQVFKEGIAKKEKSDTEKKQQKEEKKAA